MEDACDLAARKRPRPRPRPRRRRRPFVRRSPVATQVTVAPKRVDPGRNSETDGCGNEQRGPALLH